MADCESDLETDGLDLALETLCNKHCKDVLSLNSKGYCSEFCELVEEYTGQWQVPLPQLKVLRTSLCSFTKATAAFPDDCQHILYVLSSLSLSFFELLLFFGKEEYGEQPLKGILNSFLECHSQLLRHRNVYLQHVKQTIKTGGPWDNPVLKGILKEAVMPQKQVKDYLSSELPVFLELRVRYLQACERMQEAMALAKSCLENRETGNHLFFHQAYLTCLYKASLHEHLLKEMAEIDGRDAVEIICNTESVEKDELLLSLCKTFLTQQLHNGDMYYIWDLVFIWSRLYLRAHPSREGFLPECLQLASSATNVRAIFPFIKLVNTELGDEGIQVCVELCAWALQLCDMHSDNVTQSLVCKTIAFLLPHDLEICRACALLVFCQERSLEAYRTVCLLYMHPDDEPHPRNSPVKTSVRFHILQKLKEQLCFDPEFWNLLTLRTHCLELMSDKVMQAAVLNEMEEEKKYCETLSTSNCVNDPATEGSNPAECSDIVSINLPDDNADGDAVKPLAESDNVPKKRKWTRRQQTKKELLADEEVYPGDDPEVIYNINPTYLSKATVYSLRCNHRNRENAAPVKFPFNRKREYLTRCVKSQILKHKGHSKRWLQGVQTLEPEEAVKLKKIMYKGKKRGRKPLSRVELSFPDNEIEFVVESDSPDKEKVTPEILSEQEASQHEQINDDATSNDLVCSRAETGVCDNLPKEAKALVRAVAANPDLDGPPLELLDCPVEIFHNYFFNSNSVDKETVQPEGSTEAPDQHNECTEASMEIEEIKPKIKGKTTWKERLVRAQKYAHLSYHCTFCHKEYKGLNVMRHALSHMKKKCKCILCGKRFKQFSLAKKHIMDHIDEMSKHKPSNNKEQETDSDKQTPTTNGMENQNPDQNEKQTSVSMEEPQVKQRPPARSKLANLKREERIIRNLRILVRKTFVLHKNNAKVNITRELDFKDEQVIIKDDLVILKHVPVQEKGVDGVDELKNTSVKNEEEDKGDEEKNNTSVQEQEVNKREDQMENTSVKDGEEGEENPVKENCHGADFVYHLCPAEACDRVFLKIGSTLTKHAVRFHLNEENVLEKTYIWARQKCTLCCRQMQFLQQYKDHMKLHLEYPQYFCHHLDCDQRFATLQELRTHESKHNPFRPQCSFTACESLFSSLHSLYDHEWRHYIPAPQKTDFELGPNKQIRQNAEAPWKQRVKVEEMWLQNKNSPREETCITEAHMNESKITNLSMFNSSDDLENTGSEEANADTKTINGYDDEKSDQVLHSPEKLAAKKAKKKERPERDPLNVKDHTDISILSSGPLKKVEEPVIAEHKTFKPDDPAYAPLVKAPFIRPPPSTYLNESELSMRKRKADDETPVKKYTYWNQKKKENTSKVETQNTQAAPEPKIRHRCEKCLSSFGTVQELDKHKSLNTCSALFGFDSDDES